MARVGAPHASGQRAKADLIWKIAREPKALWLGPLHPPQLQREGAPPDRPGAQSQGAGADLHGAARPGHRLQPDLPGRRPRRGRAHARLVRRPRARDRGRPCRDRLRARLAGHDRLPHAEPPRRSPARCSRYGVDALSKLPERHDLHRGRRLRLGEREAHAPRSSARSASRRCAASCSTRPTTTGPRNNIKHGLEISRRVGGKHFIINTAENGRGPVHSQGRPIGRRASPSGATRACADSGRRPPPTLRTRWQTRTCGSTGPATHSRARAGRSPGICRGRSVTPSSPRIGKRRPGKRRVRLLVDHDRCEAPAASSPRARASRASRSSCPRSSRSIR